MKRASQVRILVALLIVLAVAAYFLFDLCRFLTLANLKAWQAELAALADRRPVAAGASFFLVYVVLTGCSVPAAALVLSVAGGMMFGLWRGTLIVSFASAIGASLAFLSSRYLLRGWIEAGLGGRAAAIDRGIERDGAVYLLSVRLMPPIPYNLTNLVAGVTSMRLSTFYLVTQVGLLPVVIVLVAAGAQIARIETDADILTPGLVGAFVLLALLPLAGKSLLGWRKRRTGRDTPPGGG